MTAPNLAPLTGEATLDSTQFQKGARDALRALREVTDYAKRNGTLTLTAKLAGATPAAIQNQIRAAAGNTLKVSLTFDQASLRTALNDLKTQLRSVVGLDLSTLNAVKGAIATQITQLTALIAQLRSLGGGGGAGGAGGGRSSTLSAGTQALLSDLEAANNAFKRGDINASAYATRLNALQTSLRAAATTATAGSAEFRALDQALTRTTQGLRNVNAGTITQLRTELSGARAQFDAAAAAATNLTERRAAVAAYSAEISRVRVALQGVAASGQLTSQQLGNVNRLLAQTAREAQTIRGGVNVAGLSGNISNAVQQLVGFVPGLGQVAGLFTSMPAPILATVAAIGLFTAAMASSFKTAAQFQQAMADIKALTQPTVQGFQDLRQAALDMGGPLGVGPRAAAAGILELNRAGLTAAEVIGGGLTGSMNLAGAAGIDLANASKLGAASMTAFKLSAADLPRIADNFANFSNSTFLGAEDLSQAIAAVGPVAVNAGLTIEQFGGIMATAAQGGFKNMSDAGTSLKTMLLSLQSPSENGAAALARLGVNAYDAQGNFRPFLDTVGDLRGTLKSLTEQQRNVALKEIFGTDAIRIATILYNSNTEAIQENIDTQGKAGEAARIAAERLNTYQGAVGRLEAKFEKLKIVVGEKLLPVATKFIDGLSSGVDTLNDFANGTQNLMNYVLPLVAVFIGFRGAVIAAAAPAIWSALMAAVTTFFTTVQAFIAANPLGLIATGAAALAVTANKIMADTARIYDEIEQSTNASHEAMMKRVRELRDSGTELGRTQARLLLAQDRLQAAQEGDMTGVDFWGNVTRTVDPERVEKARKEVEGLTKEVVVLRTEAARRGVSTDVATGIDPERVKAQAAAVSDLRKTLEERAFQLKLGGLEGLDKEIAQVEKTFDDLRKKLKTSFGGNLNSNDLKMQLAELTAAQEKEVGVVRARYAADRAKEVQKEYQQLSANARKYAFDVQRAELDAMRDGQGKRQAARALELAELQDEVARQVAEYAKFPDLKAKVESDGRRQIVALRRKWEVEDVEEAKRVQEAIASAEGDARAAMIAALPDGQARRNAERAEELASVRRGIQERLAVLAEYPAAQQRILAAGREQEQALQSRWAQEDQRDARERALRIAQAFQAAQDAQFAAQQASHAAYQAQLDLDTARAVAQAGQNALEVARIEQAALARRADLAEGLARATYEQDRKLTERAAAEKLTAEGLTAREVASIREQLYNDLDSLDQKFSADSLTRTREREQAEREAAEKIRVARIAAAFKPADDAKELVRDAQRAQQLADNTADQLVAQQRLTASQAEYGQRLEQAIAQSRELGLTEAERKAKADEFKDVQGAILTSQRQEVALAKQLVQEARGVEVGYARVARLLSDPNVSTVQQDLADATRDVADAYAEAVPYLQQFRDKSLKPSDFNSAKDALEGLITALEAQRQKLEALRSEYDRQRTALQGIQDVLRGFGEEFGDVGLLNNAVQFNQGTYNQARAALTTLLQGGKYDAAQLAEATQKLQAAYGGLKDSVVAVGDAQASVFEKEARTLKDSTEKKLKLLDRQIDAAKAASDDAQVKLLERQRDQITTETEDRVDALEARAEAARKAAQTALADRTKGLQQTLGAVAQGAQAAQKGVQDLGGQVKQAEKDLQTSADRMKASLTGVFKGLPAIAASAGQQAGQAFVQQLQAQLSSVRLPVTAAAARPLPGGGVTGGDTYVTTLYINGQQQLAPQDLQKLARDLTPLIRGEAQRRNPGGPCRGRR
ncbi:phage tail tape measure protein [Deinococcus soli (ex Cha et al. 2016)]|uniref:phage tail tape measure protein n=1 Tax=Deinococcus soli (ex Cha et al. 2016) TaxID=1309411 RepID=UPI001664AB6D|nr:phage tail tape measure protein [Deinococcus soli (ex Cha et al. 2016)]GGB69546.1 hypothetical protein GCM10008019_27170 [Deinococcus soli (ex Cha et al. 2016)]